MKMPQFLESVPPYQTRTVRNAWGKKNQGYVVTYLIRPPAISLYCEDTMCKGKRPFDPDTEIYPVHDQAGVSYAFLQYTCRTCRRSHKVISLEMKRNDDEAHSADITKLGEIPTFGPPLPDKLLALADPERMMLDKGYRAERAGLGIAAFAYYRRAVEGIKGRLIDKIIEASKALNAPTDVLADLEAAKAETRFTQAVGVIRHGIPEALFVNGHNPLTLLHDALSDHLHDKTDEECLATATIVRVLLAELAEKLASVFSDRKEVESAITALLKKRQERAQQAK